MKPTHYAARSGEQGFERLRVLARVMQPVTASLLDRVGVAKGMSCLDVGCGGGQVTCELARRVGPQGKAVGLDTDETKLSLARYEAESRAWATPSSERPKFAPPKAATMTTFSTPGSCSRISLNRAGSSITCAATCGLGA